MNLLTKLAASATLLLATTLPALADGISASATYTAVSDPATMGAYDYNLTLTNTGTTTIGEFWFAWVPGRGFLSAPPTSVGSPLTWNYTVTNAGGAIQWIGTGLLQPGQSLGGFSFVSTETPAQLLGTYTGTGAGAGDPVTTSLVYITTRNASDPGFQLVAAPAVAATPEPDTILLTLTGFGMVLYTRVRSRGLLRG